MDNSIRKNEVCVIGLPRCDFVFSSTRSCFIGYSFEESTLEMNLLRKLLQERGMLVEEAAGNLAPGQNAFCAKICSKIITSQFCIILLNNEEIGGRELPNANVNMEYGLMLGFNKYVIPFQHQKQTLPFNVAGLDTIKYDNKNFEEKAISAIENAIAATTQINVPQDSGDQSLKLFLLQRNVLISTLEDEGERALYRLGEPLGFNLFTNFGGHEVVYFGRFAAIRAESIIWRIRKLAEILNSRIASMPFRVKTGMVTTEQVEMIKQIFNTLRFWILVSSDHDKQLIVTNITNDPISYEVEVITLEEAMAEVRSLPGYGA